MADILISKFTTQIPRVGATPATPGFAESEGQDPVAPSGTPQVYTPVTIGSPANGLSISGTQVLTIGLASTSTTGALSSTDWNTFNNKLNLTSPITGYTVGANTALADTDTILQAFGKVQGQINARISGTIASGQVAFGTGVNTVGGSNSFWWDSVNTRVGIGTNAPATTVHIRPASGSPTLRVERASGAILNIDASTLASGAFIRTGNLSPLSLGVNGAQDIFIDTSNRVGISNITPTNTLDVNGTARIRTISNLGSAATSVLVPSATGVVSLRTLAELASDGTFITGTGTSGRVAFWSGTGTQSSSANLFWDNLNNRLGISQSSPTERLHVNGNGLFNGSITTFSADPLFILRDTSLDTNAVYLGADFGFAAGVISYGAFAINRNPATGTFFNTGRSASQINLESSNGSADIGFYTTTINNSTPLLRLWVDGNGNIGIGTGWEGTAPTARLQIKGIGTTTDSALLIEDSAGTDNASFLDNGQIRFLRLPTSSAGLGSGDLWNDNGNVRIGTTVTFRDQESVKTTASADQTLPSGVLTILDYDTTLTNNSTATYTVGTTGRITINTTGIYTITAGVVIEADAVTALESAFLGIFRNGDLVAISSINTTIAAGAQSGLSTSTILSLTATDIIDCRALVNSVGGVANGLARRLGTLLGANATQVNSLSITKNSM